MPYLLRRQRFYLSLCVLFLSSYTWCISQTADAQVFWEDLLTEARVLAGKDDIAALEVLQGRADSFLIHHPLQDSFSYASFFHMLGNSYYHKSQYPLALESYRQGLALAPSGETGRNLFGSMLYDRAFTEYEMEDYKTSYETVVESETVLSRLQAPDYDYLLSVYSDLAFQAIELGYLEDAEKYLLKGFHVLDTHEDEVAYLDETQSRKRAVFNYTALLLYSTMGDEEKLLGTFESFQSYRTAQRLRPGEEYMYAVGLNHIADFYLGFEEKWADTYPYQQAQRFLTAAFEALDSASYPGNYAQFLFNQNKCYRKAGQYEAALAGNTRLLELVDSSDGRMPFFWAQRSLIHGAAQQPAKAAEAFVAMLQLIHRGPNLLQADFSNFEPSPEINHSDLIAGVMEILLSDLAKHPEIRQLAARSYPLALEQFEYTYPNQFMNPKLAAFYTKIIGGILRYCPLEGSEKVFSTAQLLERMERIENRLAWQAHLQNRHVEALGIPDSLLEKELMLRKRIAQAKASGATTMEIFEWEDQLNKLERNIQATYPAHAQFVSADFDLEAFQAQLKTDELVLTYRETGDRLYLFAIQQSDVQLMDLGEKDTIYQQVSDLLAAVDQTQVFSTEARLSEALLPLSLQPDQALRILPTGKLVQLPFGMLRQAGRYLIEDHPISYASHLVFLSSPTEASQASPAEFPLLAFAPSEAAPRLTQTRRAEGLNLAGAHQEATEICALFGGNMYGDSTATKDIFLKTAAQAQILHLAMHAKLNDSLPELSYLLFEDHSTDGKLYVEELYGLHLQADLAVLSACNTATGTKDTRKGMVSLARAFSYAGVPATVASLWAVPDQATKELMLRFYQELRQGKNKAEALRDAKIAYLNTYQGSPLAEPLFWAGFVLYGDSTPIHTSSPSFQSWLFVAILLLVLFGYFAFNTFSKRLTIGASDSNSS